MPSSPGSCVIAIVSPAPALKPISTLSLISLTSTLSRNIQATRQRLPAMTAASTAISPYRTPAPPAICATVPPIMSEIAEVGPTARNRDDPTSA
jgi:hypothetical protein